MVTSKIKLNSEKLGQANLNGVLAPTKSAGGKSASSIVATGKSGQHGINIVAKTVEGIKQNKWDHVARMDQPTSANSKSAKGGDEAPAKKQAPPRIQVVIPSAASAYACSIPSAPGSSVSFSNTPIGPGASLPPYWGTAKLALSDAGNTLIPGTKSSITFNNIPLPSASWQPHHATAATSDAWSVSAALTKPQSVPPSSLVKPFTLPAWVGQWAPRQLSTRNDSVVLAANNKSVRATVSAVRGPATISHAPAEAPPGQLLSAKYAKTHANMLGGVSMLVAAPVPAKGDKAAQPSALRRLLTDDKLTLSPKVIATATVNSKTELSVGMRRQCKRFMAALGLAAPVGGSGKDLSRGKRTLEVSVKGTVPLMSVAPGGKAAASPRPEQVAAADVSLYCGALYPLMIAAKGGSSVSLPLPPGKHLYTMDHGVAVKRAYSPLQSVQHAISSSKLFAAEVKSAWTLAAALDLGAAGNLGWSIDSKQPGASVGWRVVRSLLPSVQRSSQGASDSRADASAPKPSDAEVRTCKEFRQATRAGPSGATTSPKEERHHSFAGRVGTLKAAQSGAPATLNVTLSLAAALQPWRRLQSLPLADSVRNFSAAVSISMKHSPVHSVRRDHAFPEMQL